MFFVIGDGLWDWGLMWFIVKIDVLVYGKNRIVEFEVMFYVFGWFLVDENEL